MSTPAKCLILFTAFATIFVVGCGSSDDPTSPGGRNSASFQNYEQYIREIAPPEFTQIAASPRAYGDWTEGEYPLLAKVFSENEPMSLYSNTETLDNLIDELNEHVGTDESGKYVKLIDTDSTLTLTELTSNLPIPTHLQSLFGMSSVNLDYLAVLEYEKLPTSVRKIGFSQTDETEELLLFYKAPYGSQTTTHLYYAFVDKTIDSIVIIGAESKAETASPSNVTANWSYRISTVNETDFDYIMAWGGIEADFMGKVIGGGNKDVKFALRYQGFNPSTAAEPHEDMTQMFGPNFSDEGTLTTGFDYFISADRFLQRSDLAYTLIEISF